MLIQEQSRCTTESEQDCNYKDELSLTLIQQPAADWEHLHEGPELLLLLQQLLQILTAPPQSNPIKTTQKKYTDSDDDPRTPRTGEQDCSKKQVDFKNPVRVPVLPGSLRWCRGPHNRHRWHRPGGGEAFVRGRQRLHGGGQDRGRIKLLPVEMRRRWRRTKRRCDCVFLRFLSCLSPFPRCGKINRGGFQRNRAYEMSKTTASSGGFFAWLVSFLPSS